MATYQTKNNLGDQVFIDTDRSIKATVVGFLFRATALQVELAWFANGAQQAIWVDEWRVSNAD